METGTTKFWISPHLLCCLAQMSQRIL